MTVADIFDGRQKYMRQLQQNPRKPKERDSYSTFFQIKRVQGPTYLTTFLICKSPKTCVTLNALSHSKLDVTVTLEITLKKRLVENWAVQIIIATFAKQKD